MVLWEITLATAYFLGLKRTYRLALKTERRLVSANHPKIRDFLHRRTRAIFDMAITVHRNIQQKDLEVGRNLGNRLLRWLDRMKPSAEIRGNLPTKPPTPSGCDSMKHLSKPNHQTLSPNQSSNITSRGRKSDGRAFTTSLNFRSKSFPTWSAIMRPLNPVNTQYRQLNTSRAYMTGRNSASRGFDGVIRKDIVQWMLTPK